jgi:hypothetical protein
MELNTEVITANAAVELAKYNPTKEEAERLRPFAGNPEILTRPELYFFRLAALPHYTHHLSILAFVHTYRDLMSDSKAQLEQVRAALDLARGTVDATKTLFQYALGLSTYMNQGRGHSPTRAGLRLHDIVKLDGVKSNLARAAVSTTGSKWGTLGTERRCQSYSVPPRRMSSLLGYLLGILQEKEASVLDFHRVWLGFKELTSMRELFVTEALEKMEVGLGAMETLLQQGAASLESGTRKTLEAYRSETLANREVLVALLDDVGREYWTMLARFNAVSGEDVPVDKALFVYPPAEFFSALFTLADRIGHVIAK